MSGPPNGGGGGRGGSHAGTTRICPHCKATILESSAVCPVCRHHLRFNPSGSQQRRSASFTPLRVEGTIHHPGDPGAESWEYSVVISIRDHRGEEVTRQVVGVGAMRPADQRTFALEVEVFTPATARIPAGTVS